MYLPPRVNWLASFPKSGNTWVRLFLHAYHTGTCDINWNTTTILHDAALDFYNVVSRYPVTEMKPETLMFYRHAVLLHMAIAPSVNPRVIKTHSVNGEFAEIKLIPTALTRSAVYMIRDPRDVCVSFSKHTGTSYAETLLKMNTPEFMLVSNENPVPVLIGSWSDHVKSWENDYTKIIRYEDLKEDPERYFSEILEVYGLKVNKQKLRKAIRLTDIERLKKQEEKQPFHEKGKHEKFFGQGSGWENELSEKQIRRIEEDHSEVMKKYGYQLSKPKDRANLRSVG